ncbi:ribonuclease HII, partial [Candidatus Bathyarchaeota archaeon]|nr:ribonuclease HII [Candidatus Bathyarchaeota archaeon]
DSKKLSAKKRVALSAEIKELALGYRFFELSPRTIDKVVFRNVPLRRLNYLETMAMAWIIRELKPSEAHVDPCDVVSERVASQIKGVLPFDLVIRCEPKADAKYPATGAASILAKVLRDSRIAALRELHGDFNSGYPSDWKTQNFIRDYFSENTECPDFIRASWSTVRKYM